MQKLISKEKCCGCYSCYNVCPKKAINMVEDELGFKYPYIDDQKCIGCNMCIKACPILNNKETPILPKIINGKT